ncbi:MAG TPA: cytochrome c [Anaerolineales bacterium]|nr:cytochrome c [Anaerolineales bacterium]
MSPRSLILAGFGFLALAVILFWLFQGQAGSGSPVVVNGTAVPPLPALDRSAAARGEPLYLQHCAACHGIDLSGAPDWKTPLQDGSFPAPPHDDDGHTWHHPDFQLMQIVAEGGASYGGTMPGFAGQLSPDEMDDILEYIKSRWGSESREYQWWITNVRPGP